MELLYTKQVNKVYRYDLHIYSYHDVGYSTQCMR
jgi:hypothetical protein